MANELNETDLRRFAILGAEARLLQIAEEAAAIYTVFPELRDRQDRGANGHRSGKDSSGRAGVRGRKRRSLDSDQRKAVSERMKKYWAERRSRAGGGNGTESASDAAGPTTTREEASAEADATERSPRKMSAAARKRISDAQKARWAAHKGRGTTGTAGSPRTSGARKKR